MRSRVCTECGRCDEESIPKLSDGGSDNPGGSGDPVNPTKPGDPDNTPKTGNESGIFGWLALLIASGATLVGATVSIRKRKENKAK